VARNIPIGLIVAVDENNSASGTLFYDDADKLDPIDNGEYFLAEYTLSGKTLRIDIRQNTYSAMGSKVLDTIRLMGSGPVSSVIGNGNGHSDYATKGSGIIIRNLRLPANSDFIITYT